MSCTLVNSEWKSCISFFKSSKFRFPEELYSTSKYCCQILCALHEHRPASHAIHLSEWSGAEIIIFLIPVHVVELRSCVKKTAYWQLCLFQECISRWLKSNWLQKLEESAFSVEHWADQPNANLLESLSSTSAIYTHPAFWCLDYKVVKRYKKVFILALFVLAQLF